MGTVRHVACLARLGLFVAAFSSCLGVFPAAAASALVIGVPAWPSAEVTAEVIAQTVRDRFQVTPELRERGTMTILSDIAAGEIDIHPEIWFPNLERAVERLGGASGSLIVSPHSVVAEQNVCATKATVEQTGIVGVSDLARPEMAAKFDSDGDGKGEIWIGASTWSSTDVEKIRARSYGYDRTMSLLEMPEEVAMAAVDVAESLGRPIVFYCYGPHHLFDLHEIVVLQEPPFDPARWHVVPAAEDPDWLEKSQAPTEWDRSHFHLGWAASLETEMPEVAGFLGRIRLEPGDTTRMSYAVQVEGKSPEEAAAEWIENNQDRLAEWTK